MSDIETLRTSAIASIEAAASTAELEELRVQDGVGNGVSTRNYVGHLEVQRAHIVRAVERPGLVPTRSSGCGCGTLGRGGGGRRGDGGPR